MKGKHNVREEPRGEAAPQLEVTKTTWVETNIKEASWSKSHGDRFAQKNVV